MQQHIHRTDAQHRVIEIKAMEQAMVEVHAQLRIAEQHRVVFPQVFAHRHRKAAGAAGRIHHHIGGLRLGHRHHQLNNVARGAELALGACRGQFVLPLASEHLTLLVQVYAC
jgi:hypothetical protein